MKAIILAAGMASRLRPLTDSKPKCLLKIGEKCLLERTFNSLIENGINDFIVVTGYLHQQIEYFLKEKYPMANIEFIFNSKYATTNNIYSLWLTEEYVKGKDAILLDSDILFDSKVVNAVLNNKSPNALALNNHELGDEEIKVIVDSKNQVTEISKTCAAKKAIGESVGIEKMSANYTTALFDELKDMIINEKLDNVFYERAFERLIPKGFSFMVEDTTNFFSIELDTVEDFKLAQQLIPQNIY